MEIRVMARMGDGIREIAKLAARATPCGGTCVRSRPDATARGRRGRQAVPPPGIPGRPGRTSEAAVDQPLRRLATARHHPSIFGPDRFDHDGWHIEDFDLPVNLMLAVPCRVLAGDARAALEALRCGSNA